MRLLKLEANGEITLTKDIVSADAIPPYAILSHTWGSDTDEVTFEDLNSGQTAVQEKPGYHKILFCAKQAKEDNLQYFWVDTCCINKANQNELAQAINSMFRWYKKAARCYVYLQDLSSDGPDHSELEKCRWFGRGWTLQELIAPSIVEFFSKEGVKIGDKLSLEASIYRITGIPISALRGGPISSFSFDDRLSWAFRRKTTIEEDQVYCMLGIFGIFLPLLYGEGTENAMRRLQGEFSTVEGTSSTTHAPSFAHTEACLASLDAIKQADYIKQTLDRSQGSCRWIHRMPSYIYWLNQQMSRVLFITGKLGYGKTTLAAHVAHDITQTMEENVTLLNSPATTGQAKSVVLTFFFRPNEHGASQSALDALRTIAYQLAQKRPETLNILLDRFKRISIPGSTIWSWSEIVTVLRLMFNALGTNVCVYIIFDAINDCEMKSQASIIEWMRSTVETRMLTTATGSGPLCKICATSRPQGNLLDPIKGFSKLEIDANYTKEDMDRLIETLVGQFARHRQVPPEIVRKVAHSLHQNADGMFLWVDVVMKKLQQRNKRLSDESIIATLERIPPTIAESYRGMISAPPLPRREDMWRILRWLLYSHCYMTIPQLEIALCLEHNVSTWYGFADDVDYLCGPLITIDPIEKNVRLAHKTVRGFLESFVPSSTTDLLSRIIMTSQEAHEHLAIICIQHLSEQDVWLQRMNRRRREPDFLIMMDDFLNRNPFLRYAISGWAHHARGAERLSPRLSMMLRTLLADIHRRAILIYLICFCRLGFHSVPMTTTYLSEPIHLAAYFNIPELVKYYLNDGVAADVFGATHDTPLIWGSELGSTESVKVLLDAGANPNQLEDDQWSALHWAARNGHLEIAKVLISRGAQVHHRDSRGQTPLDWAIDQEHWDIIDILHQGRSEDAMKLANIRGSGPRCISGPDDVEMHDDPHVDLSNKRL